MLLSIIIIIVIVIVDKIFSYIKILFIYVPIVTTFGLMLLNLLILNNTWPSLTTLYFTWLYLNVLDKTWIYLN